MTVASIAERVVAGSRPFFGAGGVRIGETITDPAIRSRLNRLSRLSSVTHWRLRNVSLDPWLALMFADGEALEQTRYVVFEGEEVAARERLAKGRMDLRGKHLWMGFNRVYSNYYHWITQCVPAIASYQDASGSNGGELLLRPLSQVQLRALELAGIPLRSWTIITQPTTIDVADITYSSLLATHSPSLFGHGVFDRMAGRVAASTSTTGAPRLIYVWRIDSRARPMSNEDALVELLLGYGVEPVILSSLNLDDQIRLFRDARLIIGPHGAGLCNIVFCHPGAVLYELFPDHYVNPCVNQIAQARDLHYWCDAFRAEARPDLWRHATPWRINLDVVRRRLEEILSFHEIL